MALEGRFLRVVIVFLERAANRRVSVLHVGRPVARIPISNRHYSGTAVRFGDQNFADFFSPFLLFYYSIRLS